MHLQRLLLSVTTIQRRLITVGNTLPLVRMENYMYPLELLVIFVNRKMKFMLPSHASIPMEAVVRYLREVSAIRLDLPGIRRPKPFGLLTMVETQWKEKICHPVN